MIAARKTNPLQHMLSSVIEDVTPTRLRLMLVCTWVLALAFCALSIITVGQHEAAARTLGRDATPSVVSAQLIATTAQQMDFFLSSELLYPAQSPEAKLMRQSFDNSSTVLSKSLVAAAKNITYGKEEQVPIERLIMALGRYEMQVQETRDLRMMGRDAEVLGAYRKTVKTLQEELVANAEKLCKANVKVLDDIYSEEKSKSAFCCGLVLVLGVSLMIALLYIQGFLRARFRRWINVPLAVATILTIFFVNHLNSEVRDSGYDLKGAKEDAYDSIYALIVTRSHAWSANAAQGRWLLDRENAEEHAKTFKDEIDSIVSFSAGSSFATTVERAQKQLSEGAKLTLTGFSGTLVDELANIEYEHEGQTAVEALKSLGEFCAIDQKVRELETNGQHDAALKLGLGYYPNASKFAFTKFDDAINRAIEINQQHFENNLKCTYQDLKGLVGFIELFTLSVVLLSYLGMHPRMAEYIKDS